MAVADLPPERRRAVEAYLGGSVSGLLRHRHTGTWQTGVDHDTAVLFHALATPQAASTLLLGQPAARRQRVLARLVCDQVLQVEADEGFVDGVAARPVLFDDQGERLSGRLDALSSAALSHAVGVGPASMAALARRLYTFNTMPLTRHWQERLADVRGWLGFAAPSTYVEQPSRTENGSWWRFSHRTAVPHADLRHKIYVSPLPTQLPEVLAVVARTCAALDVPAFKVGATLAGVLRPDKLVVYLAGRAELRGAADALGRALDGVEGQGVPFAAPIDSAGLLSWAIDPDGSRPGASWRVTVAEGLAHVIARAQGPASPADIIEFALQRVRLDGIEPLGWRSTGQGAEQC